MVLIFLSTQNPVSAVCGNFATPTGLNPNTTFTGFTGSYTFRWDALKNTSGQLISPVTYSWRITDKTTNISSSKDNLTATSTTFTLTQGHTYSWYVYGTGGCGAGPTSSVVTFTVAAPCPAPGNPTSVTTGPPNCAAGGGIALSYKWPLIRTDSVTTKVTDNTTGSVTTNITNSAAQSDTIIVLYLNLQAGHTYSWNVQSHNSCGTNGSVIAGPSFSCPGATPTPKPGCYTDVTYSTAGITCPVNTVCNAGGSGVIRNPWSAPAGSICCKTGCSSPPIATRTPTPTPTRTPTPRVATATPTRTPTPRPGSTNTPTPVPCASINAPTLTAPTNGATISNGAYTITWNAPSGGGAASYALRIDRDPNSFTSLADCSGTASGDACVNNLPTTPRSYTFTLAGGHTYKIWVQAQRSCGSWSASSSSTVTVTGSASTPTPTRTPTPTATRTPTPTPTRTPTPFHLACSGFTCATVSGSGANTCSNSPLASCQFTPGGVSGPASCGPYSGTATCTCNGPCCTGTCSNGVACGGSQVITGCANQAPQNKPAVTSVSDPASPTVIHARYVKVNWSFTDTGSGCSKAWGYDCASNGNGSGNGFTLQISTDNAFINKVVNKNGIAPATRTYITTTVDGPLTTNGTYYVRVCAYNDGNGSVAASNCSIPTSFNKVAYNDGTIGGTVGEYDPTGNGGTGAFTPGGANGGGIIITVNPSNPTGISTNCNGTFSGNVITSYTCTVNLDNVNADSNPNQTVTVSAVGFSANQYTGVCTQSGSNCNTPVTVPVNFTGNNTPNSTENIFFKLSTSASYYKVKNGSYQSHAGASSLFPGTIAPFDSDDYNEKSLLIGDSAGQYDQVGAFTSAGAAALGNGTSSQKGWASESYSPSTPLDYSRFTDYMRSRKEYQTITNIYQLTGTKLNVYTGDMIIDDTNKGIFNTAHIVLLVNGTVSFNTTEFKPAKNTAIIAKRINFYSGSTFVTEADGIFVGDTIDLGTSTDPLKIVGNLSSTGDPIDSTKRARVNKQQPSLFIVFKPDGFMTMLEQLSTRAYSWKQIQ